MTRKQALHRALQVLDDEEVRAKINEIIDDMPFTGWSERTIFDTIDQFIIDNGRVPSGTDFKKKGLPPHPVIKLRFGINLKEFLTKYYPSPKRLNNFSLYYTKEKEEWKEIFIESYNANKPRTADDYNKTKPKETPTWVTIAKMFGTESWLEWITICNLERYTKHRYKLYHKVDFIITSHSDIPKI